MTVQCPLTHYESFGPVPSWPLSGGSPARRLRRRPRCRREHPWNRVHVDVLRWCISEFPAAWCSCKPIVTASRPDRHDRIANPRTPQDSRTSRLPTRIPIGPCGNARKARRRIVAACRKDKRVSGSSNWSRATPVPAIRGAMVTPRRSAISSTPTTTLGGMRASCNQGSSITDITDDPASLRVRCADRCAGIIGSVSGRFGGRVIVLLSVLP